MDKDKFATIVAQVIVGTFVICGIAAIVCLTAKLLSLLF